MRHASVLRSLKVFTSVSRWLIAATVVALGSLAAPVQAGATYYTNTDNENNAHTHVADNDTDILVGRADGVHPIEFNINASALPTTTANLTIRAFDVDEEQGEIDDVYINGHYLGHLTGANQTWSVTAFDVNPAWLVVGDNLVEVQVDTSGDATAWVVNVDWAQQLNDGGGAANGNTSGVAITGFDP